MNFKSWFILSEELYLQNNTATIFHRTKSFEKVQQMMNGGFTAGGGAFHGPGLYTTYTLKGTTNLGYGPYVVKLKVNNLKNYFVLEPDIAKQIHGDNYKLKDQARILELTLNLTDEQWQKYQEISENGEFGSAAASTALKKDGHKLWENKCKGIIYNGSNDGKCICVYAPYEGLQFLAYALAPAPTTVDFIEKNWIKSGKDVSTRSTVNIRSISGFKFPKNIGSTSVEKQYELENPEDEKGLPSEIIDDVEIGKYVKLKLYMRINKLSNEDVVSLLKIAPDKDEMVSIIIKHKKELTDANVYYLLRHTSDKEKMATILGQNNIDKLNWENVFNLLLHTPDREKMAEILGPDNIYKLPRYKVYELMNICSNNRKNATEITSQMARILGPDNIDKLDGDDVEMLLRSRVDKDKMIEILGKNNIDKLNGKIISDLLNYASDKEKIAEIFGQANINKLIGADVSALLLTTNDKDQMARILGPDNINKLNGDNVYHLLRDASDKEKMAEILGQANINKLIGENVNNLLRDASDKEKMARILGPDNINKLTGENVQILLLDAPDKDEIARILGPNNINKLTGDNVFSLLANASDKEKIAEILGQANINKLTGNHVSFLLFRLFSPQDRFIDKMVEILGPENINKLNDKNVKDLFLNTGNKGQVMNFIIKYKTELSGRDICYSLLYTDDREERARILGPDNINKLNRDDVKMLLSGDYSQEEIARILGPDNINKLTGDDVYVLIHKAYYKEEMARILGTDNINKITGNDLRKLVYGVPERIKLILRKYYTGTDQEVISLLNQ